MIPLTAIADRLKADGTIAGIAGDRVYTHDLRRDSDDPSGPFGDPYGFIQPSLVLDDAGAVRVLGGPSQARRDVLYVWAFAAYDDAGRAAIRDLLARADFLLHGWQEPVTKAQLFYAGRLGAGLGSLTDGAMDRLQFACTGITAGLVS